MELSSDMTEFISSGGKCPKCGRLLRRRTSGTTPSPPTGRLAVMLGKASLFGSLTQLGYGPVQPVRKALPQLIGPRIEVKHSQNQEYLLCKHCNYSWWVMKSETRRTIKRGIQESSKPIVVRRRPSQGSKLDLQSKTPGIRLGLDFTNSRITRIRERNRTEEPIGEEVRIFDQSRTTASAVETIGLSRTAEWAFTIDTSRARVLGGNAGPNVTGLASLQGKMENSLLVRYSPSWKQSITREQSTAITVPAGKKIRVTVRWKRIWQEGMIVLRHPSGPTSDVPFRVTVMLAFDKETVDLK